MKHLLLSTLLSLVYASVAIAQPSEGRHFKATGPIQIDVSTVKRYAQAGCARLKVSFAQDGVQLPGQAAPRRNTVDFGINYCRDGQPPKSLT